MASESPSGQATDSGSGAESPSPSTAPAEDEQAADTTEEPGLPAWAWWLLAGLGLLGVLLAAILVPRARRRSDWDATLASAEAELRWLARELLPQLQQVGSAEEVIGGWQVADVRASQAEDRLTALSSSAPDDVRRGRAVELRDAVRSTRQSMADLQGARDTALRVRDLASITSRLAAVLDGAAASG